MSEQIEKVLQDVAAKHGDRRAHVFSVQIESTGDQSARLRGKVLDAAHLTALRQEFIKQLPKWKIDDAAVEVLRKKTPIMRVVATNLTDLHVEASFLSELLTQVLNGTSLEVLEDREKWCFVRQEDGYLGWAYKGFLGDDATATGEHIVIAPTSRLYVDASGGGAPLTRLLAGTRVQVVETENDRALVQGVGMMLRAGWIAASELRAISAIPTGGALQRKQIVADARQFTGVYYLWGGCSAWGIDCSGLAQLSHRMNGVVLPRDCDQQFAAGTPVEAPFQPGDLLYFWNEARSKAGHVGLSTGGWNIIHSSRSRNGVYEEDVQANENFARVFHGCANVCSARIAALEWQLDREVKAHDEIHLPCRGRDLPWRVFMGVRCRG